MDQVPKILKPLVAEWTREGFIVSFKVSAFQLLIIIVTMINHDHILTPSYNRKLETDEDLLIPKARHALARYGHQVVIGNDLHRRKFEVVFVSPKTRSPSDPTVTPEYEETWLRIDLAQDPQKEIEEDIIEELVKRHDRWIARAVVAGRVP